MRRKSFTLTLVFPTLLIILLILYPQQSLQAAREGFALFTGSVLPSLLPFFAAASLFVALGGAHWVGRILEPVMRHVFHCPGIAGYVLVMSFLSGYPMGARLTADLYAQGQISKADARRMTILCSTSGPVFITGAVGAGMLGNSRAGLLILLAHYAAVLITGFLWRGGKLSQPPARVSIPQPLPFGESLGKAVKSAVESIFTICGFVVLFAVIIAQLTQTGVIALLAQGLSPVLQLLQLPPDLAQAMLGGMVEMTTGCRLAAETTAPLVSKCAVIAAAISFGGFSIHAQTFAFTAKCGMRPWHYFIAKCMHALFAFCFTVILGRFLIRPDAAAADVDYPGAYFMPIPTFVNTLHIALLYCGFAAVLLIIMLVLDYMDYRARKKGKS